MRCRDCAFWITAKKRKYKNEQLISYFEAKPGRGLCEKIDIQTVPDFGCNLYQGSDWDHVKVETMEGAPWEFWKMGACPDCGGRGCGAGEGAGRCGRCQGIGQVRFYEDGYIGEERTRRHPKEPPENKADPLLDGSVLAPIKRDIGAISG